MPIFKLESGIFYNKYNYFVKPKYKELKEEENQKALKKKKIVEAKKSEPPKEVEELNVVKLVEYNLYEFDVTQTFGCD